MDTGDILSRLEIIIEAIEYDETDLGEVRENLMEIVNEIENSPSYEDGFEFDDLD